MNKQPVQLRSFPGEVSGVEVGALACDLLMLGIFLWDQIVHRMDMLFAIIPLTLIGLWLFFWVFPETYRFAEEGLQITHKFKKTVTVPYGAVFNYEATARDGFLNLLQGNRVKLYYTQGKKRLAVTCLPRDVSGFVETLKTNCPEFWEPDREKSRLAVFFAENQDKNTEKETQDE